MKADKTNCGHEFVKQVDRFKSYISYRLFEAQFSKP